MYLKGAFLNLIVVPDDGDNLPVTAPSQPHTSGDQEEPNLLSDEEQGDVSDFPRSEDVVGSPQLPRILLKHPVISFTQTEMWLTQNTTLIRRNSMPSRFWTRYSVA